MSNKFKMNQSKRIFMFLLIPIDLKKNIECINELKNIFLMKILNISFLNPLVCS